MLVWVRKRKRRRKPPRSFVQAWLTDYTQFRTEDQESLWTPIKKDPMERLALYLVWLDVKLPDEGSGLSSFWIFGRRNSGGTRSSVSTHTENRVVCECRAGVGWSGTLPSFRRDLASIRSCTNLPALRGQTVGSQFDFRRHALSSLCFSAGSAAPSQGFLVKWISKDYSMRQDTTFPPCEMQARPVFFIYSYSGPYEMEF